MLNSNVQELINAPSLDLNDMELLESGFKAIKLSEE
jgi:hypothetical protein